MKEFKYDLTIGMIFRNDIKYIRKCLETMQPLRDACNCQLIMTDTGSMDGSREVAEDFADILLDFEWCDDFSAARNTGIELAEGRWFAYFDCDHEFDESILEIAKFIKSKESEKFGEATVTLHDYKTESTYAAKQSNLVRNFTNGKIQFRNRVHEDMPRTGDVVVLPVIIKHWGYLGVALRQKTERNMPLLEKEMAENPTNMKHHYQYMRGLPDSEIRLKKGLEALKIAEGVDNPITAMIHLDVLATTLYVKNIGKFDEVAEAVEKNTNYKGTSFYSEYLALLYEREIVLENNTAAIKAYENYRDHLRGHQGKSDAFTNHGFTFHKLADDYVYPNELKVAVLLQKEKGNEAAKEFLKGTKGYAFQNALGEYIYLDLYLKVSLEVNDFTQISDMYTLALNAPKSDHIKIARKLIMNTTSTIENDQRNDFLAVFQTPIDTFTAMLQLECHDYKPESFTQEVKDFILGEEDYHLNSNYAALLYAFLKNKNDTLSFVEKNDVNTLIRYTSNLFQRKNNMVSLVEEAYDDPDFAITTIKEEKLWAYLGCRAALFLAEQEEKDPQRISAMFSQGISMLCNYTCKIYNPALLSPQGKDVLPHEELFSIFAMQATEETDPVNYVKKLKEALEYCPSYAPILGVLLEEASKPQPVPQKDVQAEYSNLGNQIKSTIKTLLNSGDKAQAKLFLEKYKAISPEDPEIPELLAQLED